MLSTSDIFSQMGKPTPKSAEQTRNSGRIRFHAVSFILILGFMTPGKASQSGQRPTSLGGKDLDLDRRCLASITRRYS